MSGTLDKYDDEWNKLVVNYEDSKAQQGRAEASKDIDKILKTRMIEEQTHGIRMNENELNKIRNSANKQTRKERAKEIDEKMLIT